MNLRVFTCSLWWPKFPEGVCASLMFFRSLTPERVLRRRHKCDLKRARDILASILGLLTSTIARSLVRGREIVLLVALVDRSAFCGAMCGACVGPIAFTYPLVRIRPELALIRGGKGLGYTLYKLDHFSSFRLCTTFSRLNSVGDFLSD